MPDVGIQKTAGQTPTAEYREAASVPGGDASAGEELFSKHRSLSCRQCHNVTGKVLGGPNLEGVGDKFTREQLITQLLNPSDEITPGFEQIHILTEDGKVLTGRMERSTKNQVRLIDPSGKNASVHPSHIEEMIESPQSLMPDDSFRILTPAQFRDLIAYLQTLKFQTKTAFDSAGDPVEIRRSDSRAKLRPIHGRNDRFDNPVDVKAIPGAPGWLAVVEHQTGKIWRFCPKKGAPRKEVFLDLGSDIHFSLNQGLMCVAFHPHFVSNGRYFLEHEIREGGVVKTLIVERKASADRTTDSGQPSRRLFELEQPAFNHNGGCLAFGPDGKLYAGFGDGGPQKDPPGHAQNLAVFHGSMIRVDVDTDERPYSIPHDNPFAVGKGNAETRPEIWAYGFREPWRFSFDKVSGDLYVGDVGQSKFEEICLVRRGENHGWNVLEGHSTFSTEYRRNDATYTPPLLAYPHGVGFSVTGGHVYHGAANPAFHGVYIFGDYATRQIWGLRQVDGRVTDMSNIGEAQDGIASFGVDHEGELLVVTYNGILYQLDLAEATFP